MTVEDAAGEVADLYLAAAYSSITARTKRAERDARSQSYAYLGALRVLAGGLAEACRVVEARRPEHRDARGVSIDRLLYGFWQIDPPGAR